MRGEEGSGLEEDERGRRGGAGRAMKEGGRRGAEERASELRQGHCGQRCVCNA